MAQALTLIDGLAVIGGGISGAHPLLQPLVDASNGVYERSGDPLQRLIPRAFNLEDAAQRDAFLKSKCASSLFPEPAARSPGIRCREPRWAFPASAPARAVAIGAYAFALSQLK